MSAIDPVRTAPLASGASVVVAFDPAGPRHADGVRAALGLGAPDEVLPLLGPAARAVLDDHGQRERVGLSLDRCWRVRPVGGAVALDAVAESVRHLEGIEAAWRARPLSLASVAWQQAPSVGQQPYLWDRPYGLGMGHAWARPGGAGDRVGFVAVGSGWDLGHVDLPTARIQMVHGRNLGERLVPGFGEEATEDEEMAAREAVRHGTSAVGLVTGRAAGQGFVGLVPDVARVGLASTWGGAEAGDGHTAAALIAALGWTKPGDVVLLETQRWCGTWLPAELDLGDLLAIRLLTQAGRVVVAPAGNGGADLDRAATDCWLRFGGAPVASVTPFDPDSPDFLDSGAILVGAASVASTEHPRPRRVSQSNFGARVDCFAQGLGVLAPGAGAGAPVHADAPDARTASFGFTSAAAALVAGALVALQGVVLAARDEPLDAAALRHLLRTEGLGTQAAEPGLGQMPDLGAMLAYLEANAWAP